MAAQFELFLKIETHHTHTRKRTVIGIVVMWKTKK